MSRTILDPQYANDLNGLFDGTGSISTANLTVESVFSLGANSNHGAVTINDASLTLARNTSNGDNEYDIVVINPTTGTFLNIYGSQTSVIGGTTEPLVSISNTGLSVPNLSAGQIIVGSDSNVSTITFDTPSLTIARNLSNGQNEFDFIAINQTTPTGMSFYVSETEVDTTSTASLSISTAGITSPRFFGGLGCNSGGFVIPVLGSGLSTTVNFPIGNFIGSATTVFVASATAIPFGSPMLYTFGCAFSSESAGSTIVDVCVTNPTGQTINGQTVILSVIAMNP